MKTYKVNEIFCSLQGEGYFTGTPAVFLRFSGCNLSCDFCDTDHIDGNRLTTAQICKEIAAYTPRHLVITGGEPALQLDSDLVEALHKLGFFIQVETNGSLPLPDGVDWVTCSPKTPPYRITRINELKVVYLSQDVEKILYQLHDRFINLQIEHKLFLQPCSGVNIPETVDYIIAHPHWRLSLQTHKLINIL